MAPWIGLLVWLGTVGLQTHRPSDPILQVLFALALSLFVWARLKDKPQTPVAITSLAFPLGLYGMYVIVGSTWKYGFDQWGPLALELLWSPFAPLTHGQWATYAAWLAMGLWDVWAAQKALS